MDRILMDTAATLRVTFYADEAPVDATGTVTVTVTGDNGTVVVPATAAADGTGTGVYELVIDDTVTADVDKLTATWVGTIAGKQQTIRTTYEVVGGFYFNLAELRAMDSLSDTTKYPTAKLARERTRIETLIDRAVGTSFVRRYRRHLADGRASRELQLPDSYVQGLLSVAVGGVAYEPSVLAGLVVYSGGIVRHAAGGYFASGYRNVDVRFAAGAYSEVPEDLRDAALMAARTHLLEARSGIPDRAMSITNEFGNINLASASANRPTGLPEVDAVILGYRDQLYIPGIA